jgi:hypothetical protein
MHKLERDARIQMKNKLNLVLLVATIFAAILSISFASAAIDTATLNTANWTEFTTTTPAINVTFKGNCSAYYVNITANSAVVASNQLVTNNTATSITVSALSTRTTYNVNATAWNSTCTSDTNSTITRQIFVNGAPTISAVTVTGGVVKKAGTATWTTTWSDGNSSGSGTDSVKVFACSTNSFNGTNCASGATKYCNSTYEADSSTTCAYVVPSTAVAGTKQAWIFVVDDRVSYSAGTQSNFLVGGMGAPECESDVDCITYGIGDKCNIDGQCYFISQQAANPYQPQQQAVSNSETPVGSNTFIWWVIGIIVVIVVIVAIYYRAKK